MRILVLLAILASIVTQSGCLTDVVSSSNEVDGGTTEPDGRPPFDSSPTTDAPNVDTPIQVDASCTSHTELAYAGNFPRAYYLNVAASTSGYMVSARQGGLTHAQGWVWNVAGELQPYDPLINRFFIPTSSGDTSYRPINFIMGTADGGYLASVKLLDSSNRTRNYLVRLNSSGMMSGPTQHTELNPNDTNIGLRYYGTTAADGEWIAGETWHYLPPSFIKFGKVETNTAAVPNFSSVSPVSTNTPFCPGGIARNDQVTAFARTYYDPTDGLSKMALIRQNDTGDAQETLLATPVASELATCNYLFEVWKLFAKENSFVVLWHDQNYTVSATTIPVNGNTPQTFTFTFPGMITDLVPVNDGYLASYMDHGAGMVGAILLNNSFQEVARWNYPFVQTIEEWPQIAAIDRDHFILVWSDNNQHAQIRVHKPSSCN